MASEKSVFRGSVAPKPAKPAEQEKKKSSAAKAAAAKPSQTRKASVPAGKKKSAAKATAKKEFKATPRKETKTAPKASKPSRNSAKTSSETSKQTAKATKASNNSKKAAKPRKESKAAPGKSGKAAGTPPETSRPATESSRKVSKSSSRTAGKDVKGTAAGKKSAQAETKKSGKGQNGVKTNRKAEKKTAVARQAEKKKTAQSNTRRKTARSTNKELHLNVKAAYLVNMSNGKIYYEQNPDTPIAPASITKVLTLYLVREAIAQGKLASSTAIPVSARAVRTGGSRMSLKRGEKVPLHELIKGISVVSANNACVAVAEYMGKGDPSKFVSQMNAKAKKIGMSSSRFKNPNGLPAPGQLSTARDIAKLSMSYLRKFPESLSVHSMTTHTYHGATYRNANSLLRTYTGADGLKTGFVCASGYNITATAKRGNTRLLAVVLGAQNSVIRQVETARLLDYGFKCASMEKGLGNSGGRLRAKKKS